MHSASTSTKILELGDLLGGRVQAGQDIPTISDVIGKLVSNSLDACAQDVEVGLDVRRNQLFVADDGDGIDRESLDLLGEHLATSKVGRSGRTLYSLSYIGVVVIDSRARGLAKREPTMRKVLHLGKALSMSHSPHDRLSCGTTIQVKNIFSGLPVRQKIAVSSADKVTMQVRGLLQRYALASPMVKFTLRNGWRDNKIEWSYNGAKSTRESFSQLFGRSLGDSLQDISMRLGELRLSGLVSRPLLGDMQRDAAKFFIYVNGVHVSRARKIEQVVFGAFRKALERQGQATTRSLFPCAVLAIEGPDGITETDQISLQPKVYGQIIRLVEAALATVVHKNWTEEHQLEEVENSCSQDSFCSVSSVKSDKSTYFIDTPQPSVEVNTTNRKEPGQNVETKVVDQWKAHSLKRGRPESSPELGNASLFAKKLKADEGATLTRSMLETARIVAQAGAKFIIARAGNDLLCIDQHAADERIRLERFEALYNNVETRKEVAVVHVLPSPEIFQASSDQQQCIVSQRRQLDYWGFRAAPNPIDTRSMVLLQVPSIHSVPLGSDDMLETAEFAAQTPGLVSHTIPPPIRRALVSRACRGAIKFGDQLTPQQMRDMLQDLSRCAFPFQCAHGRPTATPLARIIP